MKRYRIVIAMSALLVGVGCASAPLHPPVAPKATPPPVVAEATPPESDTDITGDEPREIQESDPAWVIPSGVAPVPAVEVHTLADIVPTPTAQVTPLILTPICDVKTVAAQPDPQLDATDLKVGTVPHTYMEIRVGKVRTFTDVEKEIALRVLNLQTCTTRIILVKKTYGTRSMQVQVLGPKGKPVLSQRSVPVALVKAPSGWDISVQPRASGIEWNDWATLLTIASPSADIVVGIHYPVVYTPPRNGVRVKTVTFVPPSAAIMTAPFVAGGESYLDDLVSRAFGNLRSLGVMSRLVPESPVSDIAQITRNLIKTLIPIEHMDQTEFTLDPAWTTTYVMSMLGANLDNTFSLTCSPASACGAFQFMGSTFSNMRTSYPRAQLPMDTTAGRRDPFISAQASILLTDTNLTSLHNAFGDSILSDPQLGEYLVAAYNTGVTRVINVVRIAKQKHIAEWTDAHGADCRKPTYRQCLLLETKGYVVKYRYLQDHWAALDTKTNAALEP